MNQVSTALLAVVLALISLVLADDAGSSNVVQLTGDNFQELTQLETGDRGDWLIKFYAPWCGHCKRLAPIFEELAIEVAGQTSIAEIDVEAHTDIKEQFGVTGYPTLLFFKQGKMYSFKGERSVVGFKTFLEGGYEAMDAKAVPKKRDPNAPSFVEALTADTFDAKVVNSKDGWLVKFYAPWCGHCKQLAPTYDALSQDLHGQDVHIAKVDVTEHEAIGERFGVQGFPTLIFFKDGKMYEYAGARSLDALTTFVSTGYTEKAGDPIPMADGGISDDDSAVVKLTTATFDELVMAPTSGGWFIKFMAPWCGHCKKMARTWEKLAVSLQDNADVHIAKVDATDDVELKLRFQVNGYPTVLFVKDNKMYAYDGARTLEALSAFATGGYAEQEAKEIPTSPLVDLTDDTFDAVTRVNEPNADAWLVQFHAHWCDHCKDMMGAMLQTALTLKDHGNVHVARVDADINAKLGMRFAITGFPTLVLIRDGRVYEFDGLRDPKLMTAFALTDYASKDSRPLPHPMDGKPATKKKATEVDEAALADGHTLTTDDVRGSKLARLVMFHAPWCGHCNKLLPTFGKVATALKAKGILAGSIDGTNVANRPLMQAFRIASYPTILMLHDTSYTLFEGDRSVDALVAFADGGYKTATSTTKAMPVIPKAEAIQPQPAKEEEATPTEMAENVHVAEWTTTVFDTVMEGPGASSELVLVEFYAQWCGPCHAFAAAYEEIAQDLKSKVVVARIDGALEEELRTRLNVESYPSVLLVDKTNRLVYAFPSKDERTKDAVLNFVKGGYKATTPTNLPHPPSALHIIFQTLSLAVSELLRLETMAVVLALGGGLGYTFAVARSPKQLPKGPMKAKKNA
ncbi:hypothetical protein SPRG_06772 [Saprolegnia parasitica CBS 223.65]|uniref:Thioredoxin domain-containing protein n=1 Tax=Saprolegnia parasitica (strain CBS 223.65) TaxID=695850 RepID=A0A067CMT1_SAPPC|nr:hypothetical protein SPRG_06772 [Saprolegnia parasitica CBS 223.65]KDO28117.1 hypothetical protein SPRG_06772 [Saprolegnia parasitica CBS 223.65]|eukprot:XP_012201167.1 hypothetical protein SPRG_06772 [Saprolegnia parasitica CBS 223.65]